MTTTTMLKQHQQKKYVQWNRSDENENKDRRAKLSWTKPMSMGNEFNLMARIKWFLSAKESSPSYDNDEGLIDAIRLRSISLSLSKLLIALPGKQVIYQFVTPALATPNRTISFMGKECARAREHIKLFSFFFPLLATAGNSIPVNRSHQPENVWPKAYGIQF